MSSPRTTTRLAVAAALIALWVGVPVASLLHGAHGHRYCAEHETFEELAQSESLTAHFAASDSLRRSDPVEDGEGPEHQACPFLTARTQVSALEARALAFPANDVCEPPQALESELIAPPLPVLATAPKQSPPQA